MTQQEIHEVEQGIRPAKQAKRFYATDAAMQKLT